MTRGIGGRRWVFPLTTAALCAFPLPTDVTRQVPAGSAWLVAAACEGAEIDPWVSEFRDRVIRHDGLASFAVERYGPSTACAGAVTAEFEGTKFGTLVVSFAQGVTLSVETMPPAIGITELRSAVGFADAGAMRLLLEEYTAGLGLNIDWETNEVTTDGDSLIHRHWDPDQGLNASATLEFLNDALVAIRVSMAP